MRFILGVFVGAALMLGSAYLHDIGVVRAGPKQPFVNWDTVIGVLGRGPTPLHPEYSEFRIDDRRVQCRRKRKRQYATRFRRRNDAVIPKARRSKVRIAF